MGSGCSSDTSSTLKSQDGRWGEEDNGAPPELQHQHHERLLALLQNCEEHLQVARELRDSGDAEEALPYFLHALRGRVEYHGLNRQAEEELHSKAKKRRKRAAAAAAAATQQQQPLVDPSQETTTAEVSPDTAAIGGSRPPPSLTAWAAPQPIVTPHERGSSVTLIELRPLLDASNRSSEVADTSDSEGGGSGARTQNPNSKQATPNVKGLRAKQHPRSTRPGTDSLETSAMMNSSAMGALIMENHHSTKATRKSRPYFHSHVSLLNEVGNIHLRLGNLHLAFFYYFEAISILTPVLTASAQAGVKHSGLPSYVDAIIGVALVYISLAESVAVHEERDRAAATRRLAASFRIRRGAGPDGQYPPSSVDHSPLLPGGAATIAQFTTNHGNVQQPPQQQLPHHVDDNMAANIEFAFREMMPLAPTQYMQSGSNNVSAQSGGALLGGSKNTVAFHDNYHTIAAQEVKAEGGVLAAEAGPIVTETDLEAHGLDPSPEFRSSVATLAKRLQGCHPLIVARDQLIEAARVIQRCDSSRSVHLIPIMHMQCRISLIFDQKKLALHLMQKCLGLTYWYRNGASDAYALAIYSHKSLARIRHAIKRSDAATKIQRWYWRHQKDAAKVTEHYHRMHQVVNLYTDTPVTTIVATDLPISPTTRGEQLSLMGMIMSPTVIPPPAVGLNSGGAIVADSTSANSSGKDTALKASGGRAMDSREASTHDLPSLGRKGGRVSSVAGGGVVYGRSPQPDRPVSTVKFAEGGSTSSNRGVPHIYHATSHQGIPEMKQDDDDLLTLVRDYRDDEDDGEGVPVKTTSGGGRGDHVPRAGNDDDDDEDDDDDDNRTSSRTRRVVETKENIVHTITSMFQSMQRTVSAASFRSSGTPNGMLAGSPQLHNTSGVLSGGMSAGGGSANSTPKLGGTVAGGHSAFSSVGQRKTSFNGAVSVTSEDGVDVAGAAMQPAPQHQRGSRRGTDNISSNHPRPTIVTTTTLPNTPSPKHAEDAAAVGNQYPAQVNTSYPSTPMLTISPNNTNTQSATQLLQQMQQQQPQQQRSSVYSNQTTTSTVAAPLQRTSVSSGYPATVTQQDSGAMLVASISVSEYSDGAGMQHAMAAGGSIAKLGSASNGAALRGSTGLGSFNGGGEKQRGGTTSTTSGGLTDLDSTPEHQHGVGGGFTQRVGSLVSQPGGQQYSASTTPGRASPPALPPDMHPYQGVHHNGESINETRLAQPQASEHNGGGERHEFDAESVCSEEGLRSLSRPYDTAVAA